MIEESLKRLQATGLQMSLENPEGHRGRQTMCLVRPSPLGRRKNATLAELKPWWERFPDRLQFELEGLNSAGIRYRRDEEAFSRGVLCLHLEMEMAGATLELTATFPDLYPYFRFELAAPELSLAYHQNPFGKNLCLIGRGTHNWHPTYTLAGLVGSQLPRVLQTGRSEDKEAAGEFEQHQAEPFSDYLPYAPRSMIVLGDTEIPQKFDCGTFELATAGPQSPFPEYLVRGAIVETRSRTGKLVGRTKHIRDAFPDQLLTGCWLRVRKESLPRDENTLRDFLSKVFEEYPYAKTARKNTVQGGHLRIFGILFPEEAEWRGEERGGWFFISLFDPHSADLSNNSSHRKRNLKKKR